MFILRKHYTYSHVFLRTDAVKSPLQPPYTGPTGPYQAVKRLRDFLFVMKVVGKKITISTVRLKPAYIAKEDPPYKQHSSQPPRTYPWGGRNLYPSSTFVVTFVTVSMLSLLISAELRRE
jgi:hypothetical protein